MSQRKSLHGKNRKYFELNESATTMQRNLWVAAKVVVRGKFIAINAYICKTSISNINFYLKKL